jgi:hypothetical protein
MVPDDRYEHHEPDNTVLTVGPRHITPVTDDLVLAVRHRTTGGGRSALLSRPSVAGLHAWLGRWLADGWDGVPRRCGDVYRPDELHAWVCALEPGHVRAGLNHSGRATAWPAGSAPAETSWTVTPPAPPQPGAADRAKMLALADAWDAELDKPFDPADREEVSRLNAMALCARMLRDTLGAGEPDEFDPEDET